MNAILKTAGNPENQDRGLVLRDGQRIIVCVADGAGGYGGGAEAAGLAVDFVGQNAFDLTNVEACAESLRQMDEPIAKHSIAGETTCALAVITPEEIFGASVGDSGVWLITEKGSHLDLTRRQQRKPFIGSGDIWPVPFHQSNQPGVLLLATDGLLKYTSAEHIVGTCRERPVEAAAPRLIELVRYSSGALPDDVTLILTRL